MDVLVLDIAHGHSLHALEAIRAIKKNLGKDVPLIAGNVATKQGTMDLIKAGADSVKVGRGQRLYLHHAHSYGFRSAPA